MERHRYVLLVLSFPGGHVPFAGETHARRLLVGASALITLGLFVAGTVARVAGGVVLLVGLLLGVYGLHAFGRLGRATVQGARKDEGGKVSEAPHDP
jgi:hypothetical protein